MDKETKVININSVIGKKVPASVIPEGEERTLEEVEKMAEENNFDFSVIKEEYKKIGMDLDALRSPEPMYCSTCGDLIDKNAPVKDFFNSYGELTVASVLIYFEDWILCPKCSGKLYDFLQGLRKEEKARKEAEIEEARKNSRVVPLDFGNKN